MISLLLLIYGVCLVYAETHSLKYLYTGVSGISDFPEFISVGLVDEQQFMYFDSNTMKAVPKTDWIRESEGADYWDRETQIAINYHQTSRNNIQIAKARFNQSTGVHSFLFMYGCELDDDGTTRGYAHYGYDGEDFISFDKNTLTWIAANPQALISKNKWDTDDADKQRIKSYLENTCIESLQKYVGYGRSTLERKDAPKVFLMQKDSYYPVLCQATGFYPSNIMMSWMKKDEEHHEDVDVGTTLPNADGSFQKTITLSAKEWEKNKDDFRCVVQHVGAAEDITVTVKDIRSNPGSGNSIAVIVGCVVGCVVLLALIAGLIVWKKNNGYGRASSMDSASDSDSAHSDQALRKGK